MILKLLTFEYNHPRRSMKFKGDEFKENHTKTHIKIKLSKTTDKKRIMKSVKEMRPIIYMEYSIRS